MATSEQILRTTEDVRKAFLRDLATLLGKYTAELEVLEDDNMEVYIPSRYTEENDLVHEAIILDLGGWTTASFLLDNLK